MSHILKVQVNLEVNNTGLSLSKAIAISDLLTQFMPLIRAIFKDLRFCLLKAQTKSVLSEKLSRVLMNNKTLIARLLGTTSK
jgi:hypothetical protein